MSLILAGIQGVSIYLDDVVVHVPSSTLHTTPEAVLSVFRTAWGTLNTVRG